MNCFCRGEITFGDDQPIRHRCLLGRLSMGLELRQPVGGIDRGDNARQHISRHHQRHFQQRVQNRRGVGQAGGFDHHTPERRDHTLTALEIQIAQRIDHVARHRTTHTAVGQHRDVVAR